MCNLTLILGWPKGWSTQRGKFGWTWRNELSTTSCCCSCCCRWRCRLPPAIVRVCLVHGSVSSQSVLQNCRWWKKCWSTCTSVTWSYLMRSLPATVCLFQLILHLVPMAGLQDITNGALKQRFIVSILQVWVESRDGCFRGKKRKLTLLHGAAWLPLFYISLKQS